MLALLRRRAEMVPAEEEDDEVSAMMNLECLVGSSMLLYEAVDAGRSLVVGYVEAEADESERKGCLGSES